MKIPETPTSNIIVHQFNLYMFDNIIILKLKQVTDSLRKNIPPQWELF